MASFSGFLDVVIPWVVAIIGIYILYRPLKEPLDPLFIGIGNIIRGIKRMITGEDRDNILIDEIVTLEYE